jgi:hypothetical protein
MVMVMAAKAGLSYAPTVGDACNQSRHLYCIEQ